MKTFLLVFLIALAGFFLGCGSALVRYARPGETIEFWYEYQNLSTYSPTNQSKSKVGSSLVQTNVDSSLVPYPDE